MIHSFRANTWSQPHSARPSPADTKTQKNGPRPSSHRPRPLRQTHPLAPSSCVSNSPGSQAQTPACFGKEPVGPTRSAAGRRRAGPGGRWGLSRRMRAGRKGAVRREEGVGAERRPGTGGAGTESPTPASPAEVPWVPRLPMQERRVPSPSSPPAGPLRLQVRDPSPAPVPTWASPDLSSRPGAARVPGAPRRPLAPPPAPSPPRPRGRGWRSRRRRGVGRRRGKGAWGEGRAEGARGVWHRQSPCRPGLRSPVLYPLLHPPTRA